MRGCERAFTVAQFGKSGRDAWFRKGYVFAVAERVEAMLAQRESASGPNALAVVKEGAIEASLKDREVRRKDVQLGVLGLNGAAGYRDGTRAKIGATRELGGGS